ncbi:MAG: glycosyltransferase [Flavobacteriales bacterium]
MSLQISVVIPVYNAARFLEAAVASALQLEEVAEVVLVEDGSPDNSLQICKALAAEEPRVQLFRHPGGANKGAGASRNFGIAKASQEYIAFLDADDRFLPNRFREEHRIFAEHPDADGVYGAIDVHFHDQEGRLKFENRGLRSLTTMDRALTPEELFHGLSGVLGPLGYFSLDAFTVKRKSLLASGQWFNEDLRLNQDTDFLIRLSFYLRLYPGSIAEPVAQRGVHAENRITATRATDEHTIRLYASLRSWASVAPVDRAARLRFEEKWLTARASCATDRREKLAVLGRVAAQPALWHRHDLRMGALDLVAKRETWLGDKLNKLGWKIFGQPKD